MYRKSGGSRGPGGWRWGGRYFLMDWSISKRGFLVSSCYLLVWNRWEQRETGYSHGVSRGSSGGKTIGGDGAQGEAGGDRFYDRGMKKNIFLFAAPGFDLDLLFCSLRC